MCFAGSFIFLRIHLVLNEIDYSDEEIENLKKYYYLGGMMMLNFQLTEEQQSVQKVVRKFVDQEIIPYIQEWDRQRRISTTNS